MRFRPLFACACALILASAAVAQVEQPAPLSLLEIQAAGAADRLKPSSGQVSVTPDDKGLVVTIEPGDDGYPGIELVPAEGKVWDLSQFGHVEACITNLSDKAFTITMRVDNPGDWKANPWNGNNTSIKPGETKVARVIFGYSWGKKGYALKPAEVNKVMIFTGKAGQKRSFRIETIAAAGPAGEELPVDPKTKFIKPVDGVMLGSGADGKSLQASGKDVQATVTASGTVQVRLPASKSAQNVSIKPAAGRWDLREAIQVRATVRNDGSVPITPRMRVESSPGPTSTVTSEVIAPGSTGQIVASFIPAKPWQGIPGSSDRTTYEGVKGTGTKFTNDTVTAVVIVVDGAAQERSFVVESIVAEAVPATIPSWLGKRPPVEGDWKLTFNEDFDGDSIDQTKWRFYGENYWDKKSHFSKDNTIIGDGVVRLRFEKKHGHQNDDPNHQRVTDYATGFLDTYGKWVQRYGYFEARMKLPKAPGLWPAFWMMPDRGVDAGEQWKRQDTGKGAMEFDIMEHLTRWGPYRYNVAFHWDGYQKNHKHTGTTTVYFQPDADGYITAGMLWLPGQVVYYANGQEIARWEDPRISNVESDLMFTLPCGGWDNSALDDSCPMISSLTMCVAGNGRTWHRR